MKIKVCGMKDQENIEAISQLEVDYLGFIFYKASPRYAETPVHLPENVQKVGVFVKNRFWRKSSNLVWISFNSTVTKPLRFVKIYLKL